MNKLLKIVMPVLLVLWLVLAVGCAAPQTATMPAPVPAPAPALPPGMEKDASRVSESSSGGTGYSQSGIDRKIIKTGQISLEVTDIAKAMDDIILIADELGGYVVSSNRYGNEDNISGNVSIRVPANRFSEAFVKLRKLAVKVYSESTNSQDVTEEYTDLQAQLRNLEATEAQFLALLEKAYTVEDILNVQRELSNVRGEIERVKGRIQYLDRTTDMSLIDVNLQETKSVGKNGWDALETLKSAVDGFIGFGKVLATIVIWLLIFIPLWIIIGVIVYFVWWRRRRAKGRLSS
jgi:hypothetical protein